MRAIPVARWFEIRLDFHPALRRLDLHWNVPALWQAVDRHEVDLPSLVSTEATVPWLLWRQDLKTFFRSLDPEEAWVLETARAGKTFGELCEGLCAFFPEDQVAAKAAGLMRRWVTDGLVARCVFAVSP
jgi:hypothetical protein